MFSSMTLLSNKRSVHFARPSGGCEQAKAMSRASHPRSCLRCFLNVIRHRSHFLQALANEAEGMEHDWQEQRQLLGFAAA
jgi:hypothetical protein